MKTPRFRPMGVLDTGCWSVMWLDRVDAIAQREMEARLRPELDKHDRVAVLAGFNIDGRRDIARTVIELGLEEAVGRGDLGHGLDGVWRFSPMEVSR